MTKKITFKHIALFLGFLFLSWSSQAQDLAINEIMASNDTAISDPDGDFEDWIEIHNYGTVAIDLAGYGLTDDIAEPYQWTFPSYSIQPGEFILVWASDKDIAVTGQPLHANFKISAGGEDITLTDPLGNQIDQAPAVELETDVSYGRQPDATGPWLFFYTSTPGASNNTETGLTELMTPPMFSHTSGLYTASFDLSLSHSNASAQIVYTMDGSEPDLNNLNGTTFNYKNEYSLQPSDPVGPLLTDSYTSALYNSPINIYDRSNEPEDVAAKNTHQWDLYVPQNPIRKATVIKAKAIVNGIESKTISQTFFVWAGGNPYNIPVMSLQIQEDYLFDYDDGIYTSGVDFDTWRANNPNNTQYWRPEWNNYWRSGSTWEYPLNVEFFEPNGLNSVMNVDAGMRIHGNNSRVFGIKSLRLYARSEYSEQNEFVHDFLSNPIPGATVPDNNEFKRILLRPNGTGGPVSYDVVFNRVMQPVYIGVTRIQPAIHFINGEYWGVTAISDRMDKHHYDKNFDLDEDDIAEIDCKGVNCDLDEGDTADYNDFINMRDFILNNDMSNQAMFDQAEAMLDMTTFIDHIVMEVFACNDSYERNFWKVKTPVNDNYGDGKWRVSVQDFEASLKDDINWLQYYSDVTNPPNNAMFGNLLANDGFKIQFINRFADIMNTVLGTDYFNGVVNFTFNEINPYLAEDANRFPKEDFYETTEQTDLLNWGTNRPAIQRTQILNYFTLPSVVDLTLDVSDAQEGFVKINTIEVAETTPGVQAAPYPWVGKYFESVPVTLEAIALPGYEFSHWSGDVSSTDPILEVTPSADMQIQANFSSVAGEQVVYFWMMDGNIPNDTPLENLDATYSVNSFTPNIVYTSCLTGYPFDSSHPDWRTASFERKNSPTDLNYYPEANNDIPYTDDIMKGVQVKQPFKSGNLENIVEFNIPTTGLQNIKFSFAVETNGAAETLLIDYWDGTDWSTVNLANPTESVPEDYEVREFDFSNVSMANDNPNFQIRMRFDGTDMFVDNGDEVRLNNIAVKGEAVLSTPKLEREESIKIYPNPSSTLVNIEASSRIDEVMVYNLYGQLVGNYQPKNEQTRISVENFATGIYLIKVKIGQQEKTLKFIKN